MSNLITKEELLKLGFEHECGVYSYDNEQLTIVSGWIYYQYLNNIDDIDDIQEISYYATKTNVLKLIEIAKLIGELE